MTPRERFLTVARFETPDYVPIFGFPGSPGMSWGCMRLTYERLLETGMPDVGGNHYGWAYHNPEGWFRYWGTTGPIFPDFGTAWGAQGWTSTSRIEGAFEVIEEETGAVTRQVLENDINYSMPEFVRYPVRDRASWEFYRERTRAREFMPREEVAANCKRFEDRTMPLCVGAGSTYGTARGLMGPAALSLAMYDDPELVHDIAQAGLRDVREYVFPMIEGLKPEIVSISEDLCYNHGMLLSPAQFGEFFGAHYDEVCGCARAAGAGIVAVDTDGNAMEFTGVAARHGVNAIHPYEVKAGNDLFALREAYPDFVLFGWLEKECVNEGNEGMIEEEIMGKVPALLGKGGYFPNGDHGIQPPVTFANMCRFMTLLHEVCGNPEGEFERQ